MDTANVELYLWLWILIAPVVAMFTLNGAGSTSSDQVTYRSPADPARTTGM